MNVLPARPRLGTVSGEVGAEYGNYNSYDVGAALNLPLGQKAALRLSGRILRGDGTNQDGTNDQSGEAVRAQLVFEPSSDLSIRLSADYSHQGGKGPGGSFDGIFRFTPGVPASATAPAGYVFTPSGLDPRSGLLSQDSRTYFGSQLISGSFINPAPLDTPYMDNSYAGVHADIRLQTGIGELIVIPAYRHAKLKFVFNGPAFRGGYNKETDKQTSLEVRLQGRRIGPIEWMVGGYYFDESVTGDYAFNQYLVNAFVDFDSATKSYAGFGRIIAKLADRLRLVGGLR